MCTHRRVEAGLEVAPNTPRKGETVRERAKERYYTSEAARYNAAIGPLN